MCRGLIDGFMRYGIGCITGWASLPKSLGRARCLSSIGCHCPGVSGRGKAFCGYCAVKKEKFFGWRLHLVCIPDGIPVRFDVLPAADQDLTPIHALTFDLPVGATVLADKGYIADPDTATLLDKTGIRFVAARRRNVSPNTRADEDDLRFYRKTIAVIYSPLEAMRIQPLHARTNVGFDLKTWASLLAFTFTTMLPD